MLVGRAICKKLLSVSAPNGGKTLQHKKCEHSVQPALLGERKPAAENSPPLPPKSVRGSRMAEEEKLEAGGRKERNVRVCQT